MPSRSTPVKSFSCLIGALGLLPLSLMAQELEPYDVTPVDGYSTGMTHGRDVYEGMDRGDIDREPMREVAYHNEDTELPPVQLVYPSDPPPIQEVVVRPDPEPELRGEHKVFEEIRIDVAIARCMFQNVCTEEVKKIPGVYLEENQTGENVWQGQAGDGFEVVTEGPSAMPQPSEGQAGSEEDAASGPLRPGRIFVEEPTP